MADAKGDIEAVKEWLATEVRLERYADKLESNGFTTLELCCNINENTLDRMQIVLPYHRRRFLMFVEKLREKLGLGIINGEDGVSSNTELTSHGFETGNEQPGSLMDFDSEDLSTGRSFPSEEINSENICVPVLPPKKKSSVKLPPPIPPRSDLDEAEPSRKRSQDESTHVDELKKVSLPEKPVYAQPQLPQQQPEVPAKKAPVKPPRRTIAKQPSAENIPVVTPKTDTQAGVQEQHAISSNTVDNSLLVDLSEDLPQVNSTSANPEVSKPEETLMNQIPSEVNEERTIPPIEPKRTAPKAPERAPSIKPVPKPRSRVKSEEGVLVSDLLTKKAASNDSKEDFCTNFNNAIEKRTKSFSAPGRRFNSPEEKQPSTMPRAAIVRRAAPPVPPSRHTGSSSVRVHDRKVVPNLPQARESAMENAENTPTYQLVGAPHEGAHHGVSRPVEDHPEVAESHTEPESSIYEEVYTKGEQKKNYDTADDDYESDESLDGIFDDLPELGKPRGDSVDSVGDDSSRMSKNILSPRVRKSEGYLWKQGGQKNNKGWRKRWFVFDGKDLRYFKDKDSLNESLHIIPVSQIRDIEIVKDEKRATFKVITPNRIFILASENTTDMNLWSQTLMEAIISFKGDSKTWKSGGEMCDPDKEGWLKKQGHNVVADWRKRYVAIKGDKICYYDTYEDFIYATPINCINAALAKVKMVEGHKNRFVIITFNKSYSFQGDSEFDANSWTIAIETAIQIGLGDRAILEKVWQNLSNRICADCGMKDPVWASVNFCVCVCAKCIGIHRNLGAHCSRARSLLMDEKIWNPALVELMIKIGNDNANLLLEHKLPEDDKINPDSDSSARREFIYSKYWEKKYCKYHQAFGDSDFLGKFLRDTVVTDDIMTTMELIFNKVDVRYVPTDAEDEKTPLELAEEAGQSLQAELLRQNGGEGGYRNSTDDLSAPTSSEAPPSVVVEVYEKEGFLYKKEGAWKKKWFLLKDRHLKYARGPHDKDDLMTIDLRTVTSLVKCPKEERLQMDIVTVDKTHSLKADTEEELEVWYLALRSKQVFGVLLSQQELGSDGIPHLVAKCLQFVETYGGLEMEGVYRVNGGQLTMKKLKTSFDQDARSVLLTLDECGVHDVTGVLKQYLRQLPDPVIAGRMYKQFIEAGRNQDHNTKLQTLKALISQLPKVNHDTLKAIIFHLTKVVQLETVNKMKLANVAMIFGPTLMSNENTGRMDDASINLEFSIVGDMITYYQWLFDVGDEEVEKDRKIKDASQKIRELIELKEKSQKVCDEFTLDIYVKEKNDSPCRPKVSSEMTAGRLCAEIVAQKKLSRDTDWVLFEVIENGAMERAFQVREKVMAAAKWGSNNYLIVKENYIAEQIAPYVGSMLVIEGVLHMRDTKSKSWKQSHVCLKNGYMLVSKERGSIFKGFKSDKSDAEQWPLHKLTLYVGVPTDKAAKGVDTSCGFTVFVKTDQEDIVRYMCVKDKNDMNRWLAAILNMKHPEGIWSDPSQREAMARFSIIDPRDTQAEDSLYLGRQSVHLRRKGSSKHIMEELKVKQKSLKRPVDRGPPT